MATALHAAFSHYPVFAIGCVRPLSDLKLSGRTPQCPCNPAAGRLGSGAPLMISSHFFGSKVRWPWIAGGLVLTLLSSSVLRADGLPPPRSTAQLQRLAERDKLIGESDTLTSKGDFKSAIQRDEQRLAIEREVLGSADSETFVSMQGLARLRALVGDFDAARQISAEALQLQRKAHAEPFWTVPHAQRTCNDVEA